ncbi:hypothetical protein VTN49DRAFT_7718 [Thermomyces lanuginosus]|uniref:uncharacterized protein n=1 Tax=Thermomyces lanuginosus TaxID=5541 RepID=UPI0037447070
MSYTETTYSEEELRELLSPQRFDWSEEVDDEDTVPAVLRSDGSQETDVDDKDDDMMVSSKIIETVDKLLVPDEYELAKTDSGYWSISSTEEKAEDDDERAETEASTSDESDVNAAISDEFCSRISRILDAADGSDQIHHFNWNGNAVAEPCATPPEHSMLYILSRPKVSTPRDQMRIDSIMNRASELVDPVLYAGNNESNLSRTGQDLVNHINGEVFRFYTPHGAWSADEVDSVLTDNGSLEVYRNKFWVVANGFYRHPLVPTRDDKRDLRMDLEESLVNRNAWNFQQKHARRQYSQSALSRSVTARSVRHVQGKTQWWNFAVNASTQTEEPVNTTEVNCMPETEESQPSTMTGKASSGAGTPENRMTTSQHVRFAGQTTSTAPKPSRRNVRLIRQNQQSPPPPSEPIFYYSFPAPSVDLDRSYMTRARKVWNGVKSKAKRFCSSVKKHTLDRR